MIGRRGTAGFLYRVLFCGVLGALSIVLTACGERKSPVPSEKVYDKTAVVSKAAVSSSAIALSLSEQSSRYAEQIVSGLIGQVREHFSAVLKEQLTQESLQKSWDEVVGDAEGYQGVEKVEESRDEKRQEQVVLVTLRYGKNEGRTIEFRYNTKGEITNIFFDLTELKSIGKKNASKKENYPEQGGRSGEISGDYEEEEIEIGREPFLLKGILALPKETENPPVVILLPDGTDLDENGTIGKAENKPVRDIARGLAEYGIASVRYEQRACAYKNELPGNTGARELLTEDAGFAVSRMYNENKVDRAGIYLLAMGSSADYLPAIVSEKPKRIAGAVIMGAKPVAVSYTYYGGDREKDIVSDARYFIDGNSTFPLLVLQGEDDFETTTEEYEEWKNLWKGRAHTSYRSFKKLNHYFMRSTNVSDRTGYDAVGTVSPEVIRTIADWIDSEKK